MLAGALRRGGRSVHVLLLASLCLNALLLLRSLSSDASAAAPPPPPPGAGAGGALQDYAARVQRLAFDQMSQQDLKNVKVRKRETVASFRSPLSLSLSLPLFPLLSLSSFAPSALSRFCRHCGRARSWTKKSSLWLGSAGSRRWMTTHFSPRGAFALPSLFLGAACAPPLRLLKPLSTGWPPLRRHCVRPTEG